MEYEGKLLVDGTEVKEPVFNEQMGPFLLDEQSTVQYDVDFPWGTMSTGEQPIDAATVSLNFELHQAFADQLAEALQKSLRNDSDKLRDERLHLDGRDECRIT